MAKEDIYTYMELPWLSKSTILAYRFCQHLFKLRYIDGVDMGSSLASETGTNMHVLYAQFFDRIDYTKLSKYVIDYACPIKETNIYNYFYKVLMEMIPPEARGWDPYKIRVDNFAELEAAHWIELMQKFEENLNKVMNIFRPLSVERFVRCPELMIFGTIDRISPYEDDNIRIIYDYKTGHVPKVVKKGTRHNDPFSWRLPTKKSFELHFYVVLEMTRRGFTIDEQLVDFCTKQKYFYEDAEMPKVDSIFYNSDGDPIDARDYYRIGIIYTGNDEPWVPKKLIHKRSLLSVFSWINKIRTVLYNNGPYLKKVDYWVCKHCNETVVDECLSEEEHKMIFWKNESSEDV